VELRCHVLYSDYARSRSENGTREIAA
jgi:hypothetical protein